MQLLVTGGCGFIGSHFINYYFDTHPTVEIVNLDCLYYCASVNNVRHDIQQSSRYHFVKGNIGSLDLVMHLLETYQISHVIHFAAQTHVQTSFTDALQYTQDNIVGTHTLLEACRRAHAKRPLIKFVHISTDEVYGESMLCENEVQKHEGSVLCPTNPYAATKAAAELIAKSYYHSFRLPIVITRGNNVYGPRQYPEKLIPRFIDLLQRNEKVTVQGDGSHTRAFLHVWDVCTALRLVLEQGVVGEIYNIGSDGDCEFTVLDVAEKLIALFKFNFHPPSSETDIQSWITFVEDRPFNDKRYYISNQKVKDLGWTITIPFDSGLQQLYEIETEPEPEPEPDF